MVFILGMLIWSLYLVYERRRELASEGQVQSLVSRESSFLLTNVLLVGSTFIILLGTVFPAISNAFTGSQITVTAPFFNQVNVPIFLAIILLAGICSLLGWRRMPENFSRNLLLPAIVAVLVGVIIIILGVRQWTGIVAFILAAFVLTSIVAQWARTTRARQRMRSENYASALWNQVMQNRPRYGAYLVHIAIAIMAIGVIGSSLYSTEKEANLKSGQSMVIQDYTLTYQNSTIEHQPDKTVLRAAVAVSRDGRQVSNLYPEKLFHRSYEQPVTEVAIRSTLGEDLYVILDSSADDGTAFFKVLVNPLVDWIWIGGVVLVIGGLVAFWPERQKRLVVNEDSKSKN